LPHGVALSMTVIGVWLIDPLFTREFDESERILQIYIWSLLFVALGVARSRYIVAENRMRFSMMATLTGGALKVL
jgi:O-antigen/teichoic acid export membrane protein